MINQLTINGQKAIVSYDPEINMLRGEFLGLSGGADFYSDNLEGLKKEGEISLRVFMDACLEDGVKPFKSYSGKFILRTDPEIHAAAIHAAAAAGKSLNQFVVDVIKQGISCNE